MRAPTNAVHAMPRIHVMSRPRATAVAMARPSITGTRATARQVPRGNGLGLFGAGLGISLAEDLAAAPAVDGSDSGEPWPWVVPGIVSPPCVHPRIIKIGLGVRHKARTRVVYGTPTGCTR